eukprot:5072549-Prymnesium_polylepis.1
MASARNAEDTAGMLRIEERPRQAARQRHVHTIEEELGAIQANHGVRRQKESRSLAHRQRPDRPTELRERGHHR